MIAILLRHAFLKGTFQKEKYEKNQITALEEIKGYVCSKKKVPLVSYEFFSWPTKFVKLYSLNNSD